MKYCAAIVVPLVLTLAVPCYGENVIKIGIVDLQKALDESVTGQKANEQFQGKFMDAKRRIEAKQEEIQQLQMELEVQGDMLNELAQDEKKRTIEKKMKDYQRLVQDSDEELKRQQQEMTLTFFEELQAVLQGIGTDGGYTVIMEKSTVMYTDDTFDLTDELIRRFDESKVENVGE
ncbi:OmpH family outer membrane protein [Thermodesulfobacteriota bacterium]